MDITLNMSPEQLYRTQNAVDSLNKEVGKTASTTTLGKDDFLKILITQLTHQDPTQPMEDREFIAQMAQFSTLEQIMSMSEGISRVTGLINQSQAFSLLGKTVTIRDVGELVTGKVTEIKGGDFPQILVGEKYYDFTDIESVKGE